MPPKIAGPSGGFSSPTEFARREAANDMRQANLEAALIDPLTGNRWDDLLATHPDSTIFHCSAWARVLNKTYGHAPFYLHLTRAGQSAGLVPLMEVSSPFTGRRGVCLPFSDLCPPLFFEKPDENGLAEKLRGLAAERRWKHVELRARISPLWDDSGEASFYGHTLDLSDGADAVFARFRSSAQRAIRKAEKSRVIVDILQTPDAMREFYRLHCETRRGHGAPPQPFSFFRHIQEEIIAPGLGFIAVARTATVPIAASIFFHHGGKGLYKFGASARAHQHLRPNHLVMWEGIRHLIRLGCSSLHLGRTAPDNEGLRRFKSSWGATEEVLSYQHLDSLARLCSSVPPPRSSGFPEKLFARLPLALNVLAGKLIYPHLD